MTYPEHPCQSLEWWSGYGRAVLSFLPSKQHELFFMWVALNGANHQLYRLDASAAIEKFREVCAI